MSRQQFETNIPSLIRRLGLNLYNDPMVAVRELLQNANDACILSEGLHGSPRGRISVTISRNADRIEVEDDGLGMTAEDLHDFLSTIASSKKSELRKKLDADNFQAARGIAGQFGIGFLSTFIVADEVLIQTRHQRERGPGSIWRSVGDGYYEIQPSTANLPKGTKVTLKIKDEFRRSFSPVAVAEALLKHAPYIRTPYYVNQSALPTNHERPPWDDPDNLGLAESYLRLNFDQQPVIGFTVSHDGPYSSDGVTLPRIRCNAYLAIPASRVWWSKPRVYTSGLYVGEISDGLPSWARFLVGGIECPDLDLTLGRDNVMDNANWAAVRDIIARKLLDALVEALADKRSRLRQKWNAVFQAHSEQILVAAVEDAHHGDGLFYKAVRDLVPFRVGDDRLSIRDAVAQGKCLNKDGRNILFYHAHGFRRHESSGIQESLLFDEVGYSFIDARNYYERDFLQQYGRDTKDITLIPVEDGVEHILSFDCDKGDAEIVESTFLALGLKARLSKFLPFELCAVIIPVEQKGGKNEDDLDPSTPAGRDRILEMLASTGNPSTYKPYTICVNANNILVEELLNHARKHGVDGHVKSAFNQMYYMAVLVFGDTHRDIIIRMAPGLSSLMLNFIRRSSDQEAELNRLRHLISQEQDKVEDLRGKMDDTALNREPRTVFLAYGYDEETVALVKTFKLMLERQGVKVVDGHVDKLGSLSQQIVNRIRSSSMFVGILTPRDQIKGQKKSVTSVWVIEEKGVATAFELPVLMIVDKNVADQFYGNIEGDSLRVEVGDGPAEWAAKFLEAVTLIENTFGQNTAPASLNSRRSNKTVNPSGG
jgi:molecular chaperone HtpG